MSSTIFNGLQQCGYNVDMLFCGTDEVCESFKKMYSHYFNNVFYLSLGTSALFSICRKNPVTYVAYNFYRGFVMDMFCRPYNIREIISMVKDEYDRILTFIPIGLAGYLAKDVQKHVCKKTKITQYWTDPISLGRLDTTDVPISRLWHKFLERKVLGLGDKLVFCYPLFCDCMKRLHPEYAEKMSWSDIAYIKHAKANYKPNNKQITIGHFGAYQSRVRNIFPLLEVMKEFPDVKFVMRGDSDIKINPIDYPNLDIKQERVPLAEVEELEANCDILLCLAGKSGITIPAGKVFYYGDYNKPILYIGDGMHKNYCAKYMRGFGRYEVCDNDVESIKNGIQNCIDALDGYQVQIPERMEPKVIAKKMINL